MNDESSIRYVINTQVTRSIGSYRPKLNNNRYLRNKYSPVYVAPKLINFTGQNSIRR
jgi:hypothetical protein